MSTSTLFSSAMRRWQTTRCLQLVAILVALTGGCALDEASGEDAPVEDATEQSTNVRAQVVAPAGEGTPTPTTPGDAAGPVVPTDRLQDHYFRTTDNIRIHFVTQGAKGSWVMLVHGFTSSAQGNFGQNGIIRELAKSHRVVALDTRNHGQSDKPNPGSSGDVRDALDLIRYLKIQRLHMHGYSMGGSITGRVVRQNPELLITASFGGAGLYPDRDKLDVTQIKIPMLALNGEGDSPAQKIAGMDKLPSFKSVVLPGRSHLNAPSHPNYIATLSAFLREHDE